MINRLKSNILIGGTPSSGSSLLSNLLNTHPQICCGPEMSIFCHPFFWWGHLKKIEWNSKLRTEITSGISKNYKTDKTWDLKNGFVNYNHIIDSDDLWWYDSSVKEITTLLDYCNSGKEFFELWANKTRQGKKVEVYCEKTPPNIYSMNYFLSQVKDSLGIVCVRNPADTINSLIKRGLKFETAACIWLYEAYIISQISNLNSVILVKYEELVNTPEAVLKLLFNTIGVEDHAKEILDLSSKGKASSNRSCNKREIVDTWSFSPFEQISNKGLLKGLDSLEQWQLDVLSAFKLKNIKLKRLNIFSNHHASFTSVMYELGYDPKIYLQKNLLKKKWTFYKLVFSFVMMIKVKISINRHRSTSLHKRNCTVSSCVFLLNLINI